MERCRGGREMRGRNREEQGGTGRYWGEENISEKKSGVKCRAKWKGGEGVKLGEERKTRGEEEEKCPGKEKSGGGGELGRRKGRKREGKNGGRRW